MHFYDSVVVFEKGSAHGEVGTSNRAFLHTLSPRSSLHHDGLGGLRLVQRGMHSRSGQLGRPEVDDDYRRMK